MSDTVTTRAVAVHMRKRRYGEVAAEFIEDDVDVPTAVVPVPA